MKKRYYILVDIESCQDGTIFDYAHLVVDKRGREYERLACVVRDNCTKPLFSLNDNSFFSTRSLKRRTQHYRELIKAGKRTIREVVSINAELALIACKYNPTFVSYNLQFDWNACLKSGIPVDKMFKSSECLMLRCSELVLPRLGYKLGCLKNGWFSAKNYQKFSAESVYKYVSGNYDYIEPHTAMEDLETCEKQLFLWVLRQKQSFKNNPIIWKDISLQAVYAALHD